MFYVFQLNCLSVAIRGRELYNRYLEWQSDQPPNGDKSFATFYNSIRDEHTDREVELIDQDSEEEVHKRDQDSEEESHQTDQDSEEKVRRRYQGSEKEGHQRDQNSQEKGHQRDQDSQGKGHQRDQEAENEGNRRDQDSEEEVRRRDEHADENENENSRREAAEQRSKQVIQLGKPSFYLCCFWLCILTMCIHSFKCNLNERFRDSKNNKEKLSNAVREAMERLVYSYYV